MIENLNNKHDLTKLLDSLLTPNGLVRVKDNWYLDNKECVSIIGLGKSFYGGQFSLGIDILLKELRTDLLPFPPRHLCHFRGYTIKLLMSSGEELEKALNLENSLSSVERISTVAEGIIQFALPFIIPLDSKNALAHEYKGKEDFQYYCNLDLKLALEHSGYLRREDLKLDL